MLNGIELQGARPSVLKLVLMEAKIVFTALILGLVFGSLMLCSLLFVYIKHKTFGLGGSVLTVFGVMLLGLSIWKTVEISITLEGEIEAKFEALEKRVEDVREIADSTTTKVEEIDKAQNLVIREITNVRSSVTPEGEIEVKFEALEKRVEDVREIADSTTTKVEEIDKAQNLVIREITNVRSSMYKIEDQIKYLEVPGGPAAEPPKDLSIRE